MQLTLDKLTPMEAALLAVLEDGRGHSALDFKTGVHGFHLDSVSQRVTALRAKGYPIESSGRSGHQVASYRLRREA
jgi:hypothetical protein